MTAYVVLGLVGRGGMAGYELAAFASRSIAYMWPIAKSQVYTELGRLEELGLIAGADVAQEKLPDKRVYELTDAGRTALREWIADPAVEERFRSSVLSKLFFAGEVAEDLAPELLDAMEQRWRERRDTLAGIADGLAANDDAFYPRLTALYGAGQSEAVLSWIAEARRLIAERG
jgi:PadR family transcriptional regulator AphA